MFNSSGSDHRQFHCSLTIAPWIPRNRLDSLGFLGRLPEATDVSVPAGLPGGVLPNRHNSRNLIRKRGRDR